MAVAHGRSFGAIHWLKRPVAALFEGELFSLSLTISRDCIVGHSQQHDRQNRQSRHLA